MLTFTDDAKARVLDFLNHEQAQGVTALRIAGNRAEHKLWLVKDSDKQDSDTVFEVDGLKVFLDPLTAGHLEGATVDFVQDVMQSGFRVFFPTPKWDDPIAQSIQDILDTQINPGVAGHGGQISLERVEGDRAFIRLEGGCQGCGAANVTLKQGVERIIKDNIPRIKQVIDVTDHAAGENPYYQPEDVQQDSPIV